MNFPIAIFFILVIVSEWKHNYCQSTGQLLSDLQPDVVADLLSIAINHTVHFTGNCSGSDDDVDISYWLYAKEDPNRPISVDRIDAKKPLVVLIHGWGGNRDASYIGIIKDAYLTKFDYNIIVMDWGTHAQQNYQSAYCKVPHVGTHLAKYLSETSERHKINVSDIHIVGHSLGAQIAGMAGSAIKINGTIGRITALDPAGPLYQDIGIEQRLDESDANLVDVIHTDQGAAGYTGNCGDVDFYPNCGYYQLGCTNFTIQNLNLKNFHAFPVDLITCSHVRSCLLFAESILHNNFPAQPCAFCGISPICAPELRIFNREEIHMGEYLNSKPKHTDYMLITKLSSPYGVDKTASGNFLGF